MTRFKGLWYDLVHISGFDHYIAFFAMKEQIPPLQRRAQAASPVGMAEALGQSEVFLEFQERLSRVALVNRPVLLIGERGTGKELAASRLHFLSNRWKGPLVALNCSALTPSLI